MDQMFELLWRQYRTWADTASHLKATNTGWKRRVLVLTLAGTALATVGPFAGGVLGRVLPLTGAAALAVATYFGKELLDTKHEERWTRARAAAEALKSEACKYLVQVPPYDGPDRPTRLKARLVELNAVAKDQVPIDIPPGRAQKDMPTTPWTPADYLARRVQDQIDWYRGKAALHTASMNRGRTISLALGAAAVVLSAVTGAAAEGASLSAAVLGVVTTAGGAIGAYFQAGHFQAIALKYRETAEALAALKAEFSSVPGAQQTSELVATAEAMMQAENASWLTELRTKTV